MRRRRRRHRLQRRQRCRNPGRNYPLLRAHHPPSPSRNCAKRGCLPLRALLGQWDTVVDMRAHRLRVHAPTVRDLYLPGGPGALEGSPGDPGGTRSVLRGLRMATFRHPKIVKRNSFDVSSDGKKMARRRAPFRGVLQPGNSRNPSPSFALCPRISAAESIPPFLPSSPPRIPPGSQWNRPGEGRKEGRPGGRKAGGREVGVEG